MRLGLSRGREAKVDSDDDGTILRGSFCGFRFPWEEERDCRVLVLGGMIRWVGPDDGVECWD
jgi:hypothetical protein